MTDALLLSQAMGLVLLAWGTLIALFVGIGLLARRLFNLSVLRAESIVLCFWLGWALALAFLQIWHCFLPVDGLAALVLGMVALLGFGLTRRETVSALQSVRGQSALLIAVCVLLALYLANQAIGSPVNGDSGAYHFRALRWTKEFPIVPGLAHLDMKFGFWSSYYTFVALCDTGPFTDKAHHIANGVLLLMILCPIVIAVFRTFEKDWRWSDHQVFLIFMLMPVVGQIFLAAPNHAYQNVTSPSPDFPIWILPVLLTALLLDVLQRSDNEDPEFLFKLVCIIGLACIGITIKLGFLLFAVAAGLIGVVFGTVRLKKEHRLQLCCFLAFTAVFALITMGPWLYSQTLLSGYPLYPSAVVAFDMPWTISPDRLERLNTVISQMARQARPGPGWRVVNLETWEWFGPWLETMRHTGPWWKLSHIMPPLYLAFAMMGMTLLSRIFRVPPSIPWRSWLAVLPSVSLIVFVFLSAPQPRFAGGSLWAVGIASTVLTMHAYTRPWQGLRPTILLASSLLLTLFIVLIPCAKQKGQLFSALDYPAPNDREMRSGLFLAPGPSTGFHPLPAPKENLVFTNRHGVTFYAYSGRSWDPPAASVQTFGVMGREHVKYVEDLRLIRAGDLGSGFVYDPDDNGQSESSPQ